MLQTPVMPHTQTMVDDRISLSRKIFLMLIILPANFLPIFSWSALVPAIPTLVKSLHITQSQSTWLLNSQQVTLASFLLISGRISDIYDTKTVFISSLASSAILSLGIGFASNMIAITTLRALTGITYAMSVPSALVLLVRAFPKPLEQARAIGVFGACASFGNVVGNIIGAVFVQQASYHWVFWSVSIIAALAALGALLAIPPEIATWEGRDARIARWKTIDLIGVSILTIASILFIYALTSGPIYGWTTAGVLAPLIISIFLFAGFFYWETLISDEMAALPPRTWFYKNFTVLAGSSLFPLLWWSSTSYSFTNLFQEIFHWTDISSAVHLLPIAVAGILMSFTGGLSTMINPKSIILAGYALVAVGTALFAADGGRQENYWPYTFPALAVGSAGAMLVLAHTHIALFRTVPASIAGMAAAITYGATNFGSALGNAVFNAIQTSVKSGLAQGQGGSVDAPGRAAAFWFLFGAAMLEFFCVAYFYDGRADRKNVQDHQDLRVNAGSRPPLQADDHHEHEDQRITDVCRVDSDDPIGDFEAKISKTIKDELKCLQA